MGAPVGGPGGQPGMATGAGMPGAGGMGGAPAGGAFGGGGFGGGMAAPGGGFGGMARGRLAVPAAEKDSLPGAERRFITLVQQLNGRPAEAREAARELGRLRDRRAVAPLAQLLANHGDKGVRQAAADALASLGTPEALAALRGVADSGSPGREQARKTLGGLAPAAGR